jgi:RNA polymerase sigma-70 factor (ECF subfamily)
VALSKSNTPISLLERLREPLEPEAWDRFVSLYAPLIYGWGRQVGLQDQDSADLVQTVFVKLVQILPSFVYDPQRGFRRWLRTIVLNTWRDRRKRRGDRQLPGDDGALADVAAPNDPEAFWDTEYRQQLVNRALALLQADFQASTWKAFWEQVVVGRPAKEVAAELGLSPGAAYAAKFRVLDRLRQELAGMLE